MKHIVAPLSLAAAAVALAAPAQAAVEVVSQGPVVQLSVTETVEAKPDMVTIGAGVTSEAATAVEAMRINAREMTAVIDRIKALGIDEDDIQTTGINLSPRYDYDNARQRQVFRGYQASNRVSVTLREVERTGPVLDALVSAGATDLSGPDFSIDDDTTAKAQAREAAMVRAQAMAREYAGWAGYSGVRLLEVSESVSQGPPIMLQQKAMARSEADAATPVEPGLVGTSVTVSVTYEMTGSAGG